MHLRKHSKSFVELLFFQAMEPGLHKAMFTCLKSQRVHPGPVALPCHDPSAPAIEQRPCLHAPKLRARLSQGAELGANFAIRFSRNNVHP